MRGSRVPNWSSRCCMTDGTHKGGVVIVNLHLRWPSDCLTSACNWEISNKLSMAASFNSVIVLIRDRKLPVYNAFCFLSDIFSQSIPLVLRLQISRCQFFLFTDELVDLLAFFILYCGVPLSQSLELLLLLKDETIGFVNFYGELNLCVHGCLHFFVLGHRFFQISSELIDL